MNMWSCWHRDDWSILDHQLSTEFKEGCAALPRYRMWGQIESTPKYPKSNQQIIPLVASSRTIPAKMQRESGRITNPFTCLWPKQATLLVLVSGSLHTRMCSNQCQKCWRLKHWSAMMVSRSTDLTCLEHPQLAWKWMLFKTSNSVWPSRNDRRISTAAACTLLSNSP